MNQLRSCEIDPTPLTNEMVDLINVLKIVLLLHIQKRKPQLWCRIECLQVKKLRKRSTIL